ncbi:MAG: ABC transporter permease [Defluviitaleaceae bacterium]|nr:ABC transporter permease [Defluviitaleaceae bacterium]
MHKYIFKRLLMMVPVLLGVIIVIFTLTYFMPACPATRQLGDAATPDLIEALREEMGLNDPYIVQLGNFVWNLVRLDFGDSLHTGRPVLEEISARFPNTIQLASMGVVLGLIIGIPLGIVSAVKQYTVFDSGATFFGLLGASIPNFWLGMMLILLFASPGLNWLPASGFDSWQQMILPVITIGTGSAATIMRMTRSSMLENIRQDYVRTARAKGQVERVVIFRHALKNALIPVVTVAGLQFGFLLGGAVLTETIYTIPGLGRYMVDSINRVDITVILSGVLFIALIFSFVNLGVDLLYAFIDPRIKSQYK